MASPNCGGLSLFLRDNLFMLVRPAAKTKLSLVTRESLSTGMRPLHA
jgi:hypothetical protein